MSVKSTGSKLSEEIDLIPYAERFFGKSVFTPINKCRDESISVGLCGTSGLLSFQKYWGKGHLLTVSFASTYPEWERLRSLEGAVTLLHRSGYVTLRSTSVHYFAMAFNFLCANEKGVERVVEVMARLWNSSSVYRIGEKAELKWFYGKIHEGGATIDRSELIANLAEQKLANGRSLNLLLFRLYAAVLKQQQKHLALARLIVEYAEDWQKPARSLYAWAVRSFESAVDALMEKKDPNDVKALEDLHKKAYSSFQLRTVEILARKLSREPKCHKALLSWISELIAKNKEHVFFNDYRCDGFPSDLLVRVVEAGTDAHADVVALAAELLCKKHRELVVWHARILRALVDAGAEIDAVLSLIEKHYFRDEKCVREAAQTVLAPLVELGLGTDLATRLEQYDRPDR